MLFSAKIVENITKSAYNIASWEGFLLSMPKYDCEKYYRIMNMTQLNYANQLKRLSKNQSRANIILIYYSTALIVYSVASIIYPTIFSSKWMEFSSIILSVVVLLYSIINGNANYPQRIANIEKSLNQVKSLKRKIGSIRASCCTEKNAQTTGEPIDTNCNGNNTKQEKQRSNIAGDNRESSDTSICESLERIKREYETLVSTTEIRDSLDFYETIVQLCAKYDLNPYAKPKQIKQETRLCENSEILDEIIGYISENAPCQQRRYLLFLKIIHGLLYIAPVVVLILGIIFNGKHIHISFS